MQLYTDADKNYLGRVSKPLLDRIDIFTETVVLKYNEINGNEKAESSEEIRKRVENVHYIQKRRYEKEGIIFNSQLQAGMIKSIVLWKVKQKIFWSLHLTHWISVRERITRY